MPNLKKIQILINPSIYEKFKVICKEEDIPASIKIRHFMREYVTKNETEKLQAKEPQKEIKHEDQNN